MTQNAKAPIRFLTAALWPLTVWPSLANLNRHPADDYVERTSPILAAAISFWGCLIAYMLLGHQMHFGRAAIVDAGEAEYTVRIVNYAFKTIVQVLQFFTPVLYVIGLWLFTSRAERYPR